MNTKILLATLAGAVTTFLTGWLLYGMAMKGFFDAQMLESARGVMRAEPNLGAIFGACVAWSLLLAVIYDRWASISTFKTGAMAGAWIGFLVALGADLFSYGSINLTQPAVLIVDPLLNALQSAIAGGVIGVVLGRK